MYFEHIKKIKDVKIYTALAQMDGQWVHGLFWNFENHVLQPSFLPLEGRKSSIFMIFTGYLNLYANTGICRGFVIYYHISRGLEDTYVI